MQRSNRGFTLIELLVVMAIIAILAAIVVPNVARWIDRGRMTRAVAEVQSIETALTKLLADTGRASLHDLFNPGAVWTYAGAGGVLADPDAWKLMTTEQFQAAQQIYTRTAYALLRDGREALGAVDSALGIPYGEVLNANAMRNLGTSYLGDLGTDPWGRLYNIFPGPWQRTGGQSPNIFRIYAVSQSEQNLPGAQRGAGRPDVLSFSLFDTGELVSFPAARDKVAFIYSTGQNIQTGQAIYRTLPTGLVNAPYNPEVHYEGDVPPRYNPGQEQELQGGGDDINNWDPGQSWSRFYN